MLTAFSVPKGLGLYSIFLFMVCGCHRDEPVSPEAQRLFELIENESATISTRVKAVRTLATTVLSKDSDRMYVKRLLRTLDRRSDALALEILVTIKEHGDSSVVSFLEEYGARGEYPGMINVALDDAIEACSKRIRD